MAEASAPGESGGPGDITPPAPAANPDGKHFSCSNCGANLLYRPGTQTITCPYCNTVNDIPEGKEDSDYLKERDFLSALEEEDTRGETDAPAEAEAVRCTSCGAATTLSAERTSERCPYCASPLAIQNHYGVKLNVQAVLPFVVGSDKAMQIYRDWIRSRWFAPSDFVRRATREKSLDGLYMPYWTYDAATRTQYRGQRGDAYYTTETYTVTTGGKRETRTRRVRHIRWTPVSGVVNVAFDDVLVPASRSLPVNLADRLEPWKLGDLKPFRQEYLSGFVTETYQVSLRDGFEDAKRRMAPAIRRAINADIGGDEQRIDSSETNYADVTFKHILLPIWLSAYAYSGRTFRFMINAQTGEVSGERPWSWWKIGLTIAVGLAALVAIGYWSGFFEDLGLAYGALPLLPRPAFLEKPRRLLGALLAKIGIAK